MLSRAYLALALSLASCGGHPSSATNAPDAGAGAPADAAPPPAPAVAFLVDGQPLAEGAHALWGKRTAMRVTGMARGAGAVLHVYEKQLDVLYESSSTFVAADDGTIDTGTLAPTAGAYAGVDIDGPLWSCGSTTTSNDLARNELRVEIEGPDGAVLASATAIRDFNSPTTTTRMKVSDDGLVGVFYAPNDGKRHPAILAFGGSEGGLWGGEEFAAYYSARGYAVLGVAYFGAAGLPSALAQIPLEYFGKAMSWLDGRAEADTTKLVVMGGSRGGELALLLGATYPRIKGVVAYVPSGLVWGAPGGIATGEVSSWTIGGADIPYLPIAATAAPTSTTDKDGTKLVVYAPMFLESIKAATPAQLDAATTRVEKTSGPVLLLGGADDQLWQSCTLGKYAMDRLVAAGHTAKYADDALVCYAEAGHAVEFPGLSTLMAYRVPDPYGPDDMLLGGSAAGNAHAARDADDRISTFLAAATK